jgi:hypothetical protein
MSYPITYTLEHHNPPLEELPGANYGACDNLLLISIMGRPGGPGGLSVAALSMNGETGEELTAQQVWQVWSILGIGLIDDLGPNDPRRIICQHVLELTRKMLGIGEKRGQP